MAPRQIADGAGPRLYTTGSEPSLGVMLLAEPGVGRLKLRTNLPDAVRFSTNGLVLDGGLVVVSHASSAQVLCLVIGLPLGISRSGVYHGDPSGSLSSALCLPSDA